MTKYKLSDIIFLAFRSLQKQVLPMPKIMYQVNYLSLGKKISKISVSLLIVSGLIFLDTSSYLAFAVEAVTPVSPVKTFTPVKTVTPVKAITPVAPVKTVTPTSISSPVTIASPATIATPTQIVTPADVTQPAATNTTEFLLTNPAISPATTASIFEIQAPVQAPVNSVNVQSPVTIASAPDNIYQDSSISEAVDNPRDTVTIETGPTPGPFSGVDTNVTEPFRDTTVQNIVDSVGNTFNEDSGDRVDPDDGGIVGPPDPELPPDDPPPNPNPPFVPLPPSGSGSQTGSGGGSSGGSPFFDAGRSSGDSNPFKSSAFNDSDFVGGAIGGVSGYIKGLLGRKFGRGRLNKKSPGVLKENLTDENMSGDAEKKKKKLKKMKKHAGIMKKAKTDENLEQPTEINKAERQKAVDVSILELENEGIPVTSASTKPANAMPMEVVQELVPIHSFQANMPIAKPAQNEISSNRAAGKQAVQARLALMHRVVESTAARKIQHETKPFRTANSYGAFEIVSDPKPGVTVEGISIASGGSDIDQ